MVLIPEVFEEKLSSVLRCGMGKMIFSFPGEERKLCQEAVKQNKYFGMEVADSVCWKQIPWR